MIKDLLEFEIDDVVDVGYELYYVTGLYSDDRVLWLRYVGPEVRPELKVSFDVVNTHWRKVYG